jgi:proline dehydrogenase
MNTGPSPTIVYSEAAFRRALTDTQAAYAYKTSLDLRVSWLLFAALNLYAFTSWSIRLVPVLLRWHVPIGPLLRVTIFRQFMGGETVEDVQRLVRRLGEYNVESILDYATEGAKTEADFDFGKRISIDTLRKSADSRKDAPFMSLKVTALCSTELLRAMTAGEVLTSEQIAAKERALQRIREIAAVAQEVGMSICEDAEETWIQDGIDELMFTVMREYNSERAIVVNTLQCYRTDALDLLEKWLADSKTHGYILGIKVVRGAYLDQEREYAKKQNIRSRVHDTKQGTDDMYNEAVRRCLANIETTDCVFGTHNTDSVILALNEMQARAIPFNHPRILFGQLYGMSDLLTFTTASFGVRVCKYVPFGPIKTVVPYMLRRVQENRAIRGQSSREYQLISQELKRRKTSV